MSLPAVREGALPASQPVFRLTTAAVSYSHPDGTELAMGLQFSEQSLNQKETHFPVTEDFWMLFVPPFHAFCPKVYVSPGTHTCTHVHTPLLKVWGVWGVLLSLVAFQISQLSLSAFSRSSTITYWTRCALNQHLWWLWGVQFPIRWQVAALFLHTCCNITPLNPGSK